MNFVKDKNDRVFAIDDIDCDFHINYVRELLNDHLDGDLKSSLRHLPNKAWDKMIKLEKVNFINFLLAASRRLDSK